MERNRKEGEFYDSYPDEISQQYMLGMKEGDEILHVLLLLISKGDEVIRFKPSVEGEKAGYRYRGVGVRQELVVRFWVPGVRVDRFTPLCVF